jgi:hypothetical protein
MIIIIELLDTTTTQATTTDIAWTCSGLLKHACCILFRMFWLFLAPFLNSSFVASFLQQFLNTLNFLIPKIELPRQEQNSIRDAFDFDVTWGLLSSNFG